MMAALTALLRKHQSFLQKMTEYESSNSLIKARLQQETTAYEIAMAII